MRIIYVTRICVATFTESELVSKHIACLNGVNVRWHKNGDIDKGCKESSPTQESQRKKSTRIIVTAMYPTKKAQQKSTQQKHF